MSRRWRGFCTGFEMQTSKLTMDLSSKARNSKTLSIGVPRKLAPLLDRHRYKGAYGGRGGGKSHFFAEMLLARCYGGPTRAACIREVQNSLKESVRQLLVDKIQKMRLGWFFDVLGTEIRGRNGSIIIFKGMQSYNAENIKSLEGFDIAWVEEAQTLSAHSLKLLRPTLRQQGSELWFSWNPRHDTDAMDRFFRGGRQVTGGIAAEINWDDNPWFPAVLRQEKEDDYASDPETAEHVWGGGYQIATEGAYYARLLHAAERAGRIGDFPHDISLPVSTAWDLGVDDYTAIWFLQDNGCDVFAIDYYEVGNEGAEQIVKDALPELNPDTATSMASRREFRTGYLLPIHRDGETGAWSPAVPRLAQDMWDETISAATLPGDVLSGKYHLPSLGEPGISEDDAYNVYQDGKLVGNRLANETSFMNRTNAAAGALTGGGVGFAATRGAKVAMNPSLMRMGGGGISNRPPNMSPTGAKRSGAFGEAKRANGIPVSQQPLLTSSNLDRRGDLQPGRRYEFELPKKINGETQVLIIRDDAKGHNFGHNDPQNRGPHFNDPKRNHYDY